MTTETNPTSPASSESTASRRDFVAGAVTMAAAGGAATGAQAQTPSNLRFSNPPGMSSPPGYSHVIEVTGPHRVVYFAGQTGADANGKVGADFRAQAVQVFENIKIALASVGGGFEHIVKMTAYHTNLDANQRLIALLHRLRARHKPPPPCRETSSTSPPCPSPPPPDKAPPSRCPRAPRRIPARPR